MTITYRGTFKVRQSNGGGEMEDTGQRVQDVSTYTFATPPSMKDYALEQERKKILRNYAPCNIINVETRKVSMIYRAPTYRI